MYDATLLSIQYHLFSIMSGHFLNVNNVTKAPESFDFSLLSGAFKLFSDNKPRYHFRHIQQVLFATDDVKMMSEVDFCSFFQS